MDLGDIEKFFNENFFQKIPASQRTKVMDKNKLENFMHGVPESAYEPTILNSKEEVGRKYLLRTERKKISRERQFF